MRDQSTLLVSGVLCSLAMTPVLAQSQSEPTVNDLEEVIVTAQKRSERLQDVPVAISVLDAAKMSERGSVELRDYFAQVPGLSMNARGAGRTQLILRGISTGTGGNPTVGITIGDSPFGSSSSRGGGDFMVPDLDPFDLQHIEVLRGPQGTLYGASSMGGLVKYVMTEPDTNEYSSRVQIDGSTVAHGGNGYGVRAGTNLPIISDKLGVKLSAFQREDAGYIDDTLSGAKDVNEARVRGGRVAALWNVTDKVKVQASALIQDARAGATPNEDVTFNYTPLEREYTHERLPQTDGFEGDIRFFDTTVTADLDFATLDSITSYGKINHDGPQDVTGTFGQFTGIFAGRPGLGVVIDNKLQTEKFSQELRLSSPEDGRAFGWLVGAFYTKEDSEGYQRLRMVDPQSGDNLGLAPLYDGTTPSTFKETAAFVNFSYAFTDRFDVQVGGRYSENKEDYSQHITGPLNGGETHDAGSSDESVFTYSFNPRYRINDHLMSYVRVASGYRAGGQNQQLGISTTVIPPTFGSDELVSYELGLKGDFFSRALTLDVAAFYIDWSDIQLRQVDQSTGESYIANGGEAKSQGVELSFIWSILDGLTLNGNGAYTDAVLTENAPLGTYGLSGDRLPYSAEWTGTLFLTQEFPVTDSLDGFVSGGVTYLGDRLAPFNNAATTPRFVMPSYTTLDLRAGVSSGVWDLTLYVKNLTDEKGYLSATPRNSTTGLSAYGVGVMQPRAIGMSLAMKF